MNTPALRTASDFSISFSLLILQQSQSPTHGSEAQTFAAITSKVAVVSLSRRVRKLEARMTRRAGLAPLSDEWFAFWNDRIERLVAGEPAERVGRIPLEVIGAMRAYGRDQGENGGAELCQ